MCHGSRATDIVARTPSQEGGGSREGVGLITMSAPVCSLLINFFHLVFSSPNAVIYVGR